MASNSVPSADSFAEFLARVDVANQKVPWAETFDEFLARMDLGRQYVLPEFPTAEELAFYEERRRFILGAEDNCQMCGTCPCSWPCFDYNDYEQLAAPAPASAAAPVYSWEEPEYVPKVVTREELTVCCEQLAKKATDEALWEQLSQIKVYRLELEGARLEELLLCGSVIQDELTSRFHACGAPAAPPAAPAPEPVERREPYIPSWKELYGGEDEDELQGAASMWEGPPEPCCGGWCGSGAHETWDELTV